MTAVIAPASRLALWAVLGVLACKPQQETVDPSTPVPEVYDKPSDFAGEWVGESNTVLGTLKVRQLGSGHYYGQFSGDDGQTRFVINFQQALVTKDAGAPALGNLARFTWQDGRGGRGDGWVLINPEDSALTGEIRVGNASRAMDFVRVDEG